jgi:hypothetical protein
MAERITSVHGDSDGIVIQDASSDFSTIKINLAGSAEPGTGDDSGDGYAVGSRWIDTTADKEYVCLDATGAAAVWTETTASGGVGGGEFAAVQKRSNADLTISGTTTWFDVPLQVTDVENDDTVVEADDSNNDRIIIKENGLYWIEFNATTGDNAHDDIQYEIRLDDSTLIPGAAHSHDYYGTNHGIIAISCIYILSGATGTNYLTVRAQEIADSGGIVRAGATLKVVRMSS